MIRYLLQLNQVLTKGMKATIIAHTEAEPSTSTVENKTNSNYPFCQTEENSDYTNNIMTQ